MNDLGWHEDACSRHAAARCDETAISVGIVAAAAVVAWAGIAVRLRYWKSDAYDGGAGADKNDKSSLVQATEPYRKYAW